MQTSSVLAYAYKSLLDYSKSRKPENGWMSMHFQFESNYSLTGANADYEARIKPSEESALASSILSMLDGGSAKHDFSQDVLTKLSSAINSLKENKDLLLLYQDQTMRIFRPWLIKLISSLGGSTINHAQPLEHFNK